MKFLDINTGRIAKYKIFHIILLVAMSLTVLSFFIHSMMPQAVSREEIDGAAGVVDSVIPESTEAGSFIISNLSSIAHLFEYGVLGTECALYVWLFIGKRRMAAIASVALAHAIAFIDETIQIFSGRAADIVDIWLDITGYTAMFAVVSAIAFTVVKFKGKGRKNG